MATTTARNQQDVENMNVRDRLWDSLNYSYGKKREDSDKSFAKAYSQAANQQLKTGMQRSSYGAQTLANINKQQIDAQNDIYDQQIADYENRLYQLERDEKADEQWEKEFAETQLMNKFNRDYMQDEFKYKYGLAGGGGSSSGGGGNGGYSYTPSSTPTTSGYDDNGTRALANAINAKNTASALVNAGTNIANTVKNAANSLFNSINNKKQTSGFLNLNNNPLVKKGTTK